MKTTAKLLIITLILAGIVLFSCTDGKFNGTSGDGNFNVVGIPKEYNGKYLEVTVTNALSNLTLTFKPPEKRIQIKNNAARAPLYNGSTLYSNPSPTELVGVPFSSVTVSIFNDATGGTAEIADKNLGSVDMYGTSGLVDWK